MENNKISANEIFNKLNDSRVIKWEGLSDGGKWERALEAMQEYAKQFVATEDKKAHEMVKMKITKIGTKEGGFEFDGNGDGIGTQFNANETLYGGYTVSELHQYVELRDKTRNETIQECINLLWSDEFAYGQDIDGTKLEKALSKLKK